MAELGKVIGSYFLLIYRCMLSLTFALLQCQTAGLTLSVIEWRLIHQFPCCSLASALLERSFMIMVSMHHVIIAALSRLLFLC